MQIELQVSIEPFKVPKYVLREKTEGRGEQASIPLADLEPEVLAKLCDQFREDVFKKAGKVVPKP